MSKDADDLTVNGANILLLVRDHIANDEDSLNRKFLGEKRDPYTAIFEIRHHLEKLEETGLIHRDGNGRYEVSPEWPRIQSALGISLTQVARLGSSSVIVNPLFGVPNKLAGRIDVFVLMPFTEPMRPIWEDHIKTVVETMGLSAKRADDFFTAHSVMADVWNAICASRAIVADCTGRNPNVFYEIGVAHTMGKPVILITQDRADVPFDLRHLRHIEYEYTPPGMRLFETSLKRTLTELELK